MSQKVVIERVQVHGAAPYLGTSATLDGQQVHLYSTNPDIVMRWLCDADTISCAPVAPSGTGKHRQTSR